MSNSNATTRRDFLHIGWSLALGAVMPVALSACGSDDRATPPAPLPEETFVPPPMLASVHGVLDITLSLAYLQTTLNGAPFMLRSMNQAIPAPTLVVNAGDTLRIKVVNQLPPNPASDEPAMHLRYPNSANLHTHGLHVSPGMVGPDLYGDYVVDDPKLGIQPGQTRYHEFKIGADHPPGAYWYHPHLHGSTAIQVGSGMAGALMIRGAIDKVPEIAAAAERIFMFQAPISGKTTPGRIESFADVAVSIPDADILVNGVKHPVIVMRRGEVQNWHFINAQISRFLKLSLEGHDLHAYSHDGNTIPRLRRYSAAEGLLMAPGNRDSVLVKAGEPGTYALRTLSYDMGGIALPTETVAVLIVVDESRAMSLPVGLLPVPAVLKHIDDAELAKGGGMKRNIVMRAVFNETGPITDPPASNVLHPPADELADWQYQTGNTFMADTVFAIGSAGEQSSTAPGMPTEFAPFQASHAQKQLVSLNSVEEWTVYNMNAVQHPFHIHINPFEVIKMNGVPVEPFWADTIGLPPYGSPTNPTSVTFRTRFLDYCGDYVMHCHILSHEDMGMMQTIRVSA